MHTPERALATDGTGAQAGGQELEQEVVVVVEVGSGGRLLDVERLSAFGEESSAAAVGEEAVVTDADEA